MCDAEASGAESNDAAPSDTHVSRLYRYIYIIESCLRGRGAKISGKVKFPDSRDTPSNDDPHVCPRLTSPASPSSACPPAQVRVAKLFAKHMDADAQVKSLGPGQSPPVAVGTPARLRLLAERGALRLGRTEIFVVDNFRDGRGLTIVSDREASVDLAKFMQETVLPEMKKRETIKIGVF